MDPTPRRPDDPVWAMVGPPRAERLLDRAGIDRDALVTADFSGWSKRVLVGPDRVVLFPRDHTQVSALEREERALRALAPIGLPLVPDLIGAHDDPEISPLPFLVVGRLPGVNLETLEHDLDTADVAHVMAQVGRAAAAWHVVDPAIVEPWPPRRTDHRRDIDALLGTGDLGGSPVDEVAADIGLLLGLDASEVHRCAVAIERTRAIPPALVHSDLHAGQMLVDPETLELTGVIDWQGLRADHPFVDVDLGEWSSTMWRRHRREFADIQTAFWTGYASVGDVPGDTAALSNWVWAVAHAQSFEHLRMQGPGRESVVGTRDEAIALARDATRHLPT